MSTERRRYRVRVHLPGSDVAEDSNVDFTVDVGNDSEISRLVRVPIVGGQTVHPLQGRSDRRPFVIEAIDFEGTLTEDLSFGDSSEGRWQALFRLFSAQYQEIDASGSELSAWVTFATGRCTQLDELDGPGKLRLEISDESVKLRNARVFEHADTTQIWPAGPTHQWRGFPAAVKATITRQDLLGGLVSLDNTFFVTMDAIGFDGGAGTTERGGVIITDRMLQWVRGDLKPDTEIVEVGDESATGGNFRHLRLRFGNDDYEIISFANPPGAPILQALEEPDEIDPDVITDQGSWGIRIWAWVYKSPSQQNIPDEAEGFLYAPTAAPSEDLPLHVGLADSGHLFGTTHGFIHLADLFRRVCELVGLVYDPDNLNEFEADKSFPALAPRVTELSERPLEWLQRNIFAFCGVTHGRDVLGRLKLIDLRPPRAIPEYLTVLTPNNARNHRWRLSGDDMRNSIQWKFLKLTLPPPRAAFSLRDIILKGGADDDPIIAEDPTLDNFYVHEDLQEPEDGDTLADAGRVVHLMDARAAAHIAGGSEGGLFGGLLSRHTVNAIVVASGAGSLIEPYREFMTTALLNTYQDGPIYGTIEVHGDVGDTIEEGDQFWIDLDQFHIPSPGRLGVGLPGSVGPQVPGEGQPALESPPTLGAPTLNADRSIAVAVASIPITQDQARVEFAVSSDPSEPPAEDSQSWLTACVLTSIGSCTIPAQNPDVNVWIRVSGEDDSGLRLSSYSTPVVVEIPNEPRLDSAALVLDGATAIVTWDPNILTQGVLVQYAEHAPATNPETFDYAEVDADTLTFTIPLSIDVGNFITVILTAFSGFDSGGVDSPPGASITLSKQRAETLSDALDHALGDHTDTDFDTPQDGDVVQWDETLAKFIVGPAQAEAAPHTHTFLELTDTPDSYAGSGGFVVQVNAGATGLEFVAGGGGGTLNGLSDVVLDSPEGQDVLRFVDSDDVWVNSPPDIYIGDDHFPQVVWGGRLAYRLDRGILYKYDSNLAKWLSAMPYTIYVHGVYAATASGNGSLMGNPWAGQYDLYVETFRLTRIISPGTGNWTAVVHQQSGASDTTLATSAAFTTTTWDTADVTVNTIVTSDVDGFYLQMTENSGTGTAYGVPTLICRLIG